MQLDAEGGLIWEIPRGTSATRNTYTFDLDIPLVSGQQITEGDQTLMMFPHTIQADLYIHVWLDGENLERRHRTVSVFRDKRGRSEKP